MTENFVRFDVIRHKNMNCNFGISQWNWILSCMCKCLFYIAFDRLWVFTLYLKNEDEEKDVKLDVPQIFSKSSIFLQALIHLDQWIFT